MSIIKKIVNNFKGVLRFLKHIFVKRSLIYTLAISGFREQYLGSYLGLLWAILRPSIFISVIWFVFSLKLKGQLIDSRIPFILYLLSGYVPWFFFSESVSSGMGSIVSNKSLVNKVSFRASILPLCRIGSALIIHFIFLFIFILILLLHGYRPTLYWLQLPYYLSAMILLLLGVSWLTASLRVFAKDVAQIIASILQIGFWATPIFWSLNIIPPKYMYIMEFNPLVYIINGYRNTFLNEVWFWNDTNFLVSFMLYAIFFFFVGSAVFRKLRPHFGDVL